MAKEVPEMTEADLEVLREDAVKFMFKTTIPDADKPATSTMAGLIVLIHRVKHLQEINEDHDDLMLAAQEYKEDYFDAIKAAHSDLASAIRDLL